MSSAVSSTGRYARYVGRVGALAVSLGVGFAVASTPGVAWADGSTADSATSTNESTNGAASAASTESAGAASRQERRQERRRTLRVFAGIADNTSRHVTKKRPTAASNTDTDTDTDTATDSGNNVVAKGARDADDHDTAGPRISARRSSNDVARPVISIRQALPSRVVQRQPVVPRRQKAAETVDATPVQSSTATAKAEAPAPNVTTTVVAQQTPTPTAARTPVVTRPAALVTGFLAAVGLAPSLTTPTAPPPAPAGFVWAVLAFVRREIGQIQQTYLNRSPRAYDDTVPASEDTSVTFNPLANDVDPDRRDTITVASYTQPTHGAVVQNADGTFTYTPAANYNGADSFTYTVTDETSPAHVHGLLGWLTGGGHTSTATVNITVAAVNDAPVATGGSVTVNQDNVLHGTLTATDVDGDTLTYTLGTLPTHGTVVITNANTGAYTYTPNAGFNGADAFTFAASDANTTSNTATVAIDVQKSASAPDASISAGAADPVTGDVTVRTSYTDSAGDPIHETLSTPQYGSFVGFGFGSYVTDGVTVSGSFTRTYEPTLEARLAAYNGTGPTSETLTYTVSDGQSTSVRTVNIPITPARTPATVTAGEADAETGEVPITLTYLQNADDPAPTITNDAELGEITAVSTTVTTDGETTKVVRTYVYTPTPDARADAANGTGPNFEDVTFTVDDGQAVSLPAVSVSITPAEAVVTDTVSTESTPTDVSVALDGATGVIVNDDGTVTVIDQDEDGWSLGPAIDIGGTVTSVDTDWDTGYVSSWDDDDGYLTGIDLDTGDAWSVSTGVRYATDVAVDRSVTTETTRRVYVAGDDGSLVSVDPVTRRVVGRVDTQVFARESVNTLADNAAAPRSAAKVAVAPGGEKVYVASGGRITAVEARRVVASQLRVADDTGYTDSLEVVGGIDVDGDVTDIEVSADGRLLYATVVDVDGGSSLVAYDATTLERVRSVSVGADARAVAISDDGNRGYVTRAGAVSVVALDRMTVIDTVRTPAGAGVAFVPGRDTVLVTNPSVKTLSVITDRFDAPTVVNADTASTGQQNSVLINVLANDTDAGGAGLTPTVVTGPADGVVVVNADGTITYTPNTTFYGTDVFSYSVTGGSSNAAPTTVSVTVTPAITTELTWNADPRDLDAHLIGPSATGSGTFHVYFGDTTYEITSPQGTEEAAAFLVSDDVDGGGPERISVNTRTPGDYIYYVHKYAGDATLAASGATVTVVVDPSTGLAQTFTVDPDSAGDYWAVFKMTVADDGSVTITPLNAYGDDAPTLLDETSL